MASKARAGSGRNRTRMRSRHRSANSSSTRAIRITPAPGCGMTASSIRPAPARCWHWRCRLRSMRHRNRPTSAFSGCDAMSGLIQIEHQAGVATLWLNRPDKHNAFDERLIAAITDALRALAGDDAVRAVVLAGRGRSFSAGGDLDWMRRAAGYGYEENLADANALATMLRTLAELPKPT